MKFLNFFLKTFNRKIIKVKVIDEIEFLYASLPGFENGGILKMHHYEYRIIKLTEALR